MSHPLQHVPKTRPETRIMNMKIFSIIYRPTMFDVREKNKEGREDGVETG